MSDEFNKNCGMISLHKLCTIPEYILYQAKKLNASNINICKITCNLNIYLNVIISMITFGPNLYCCDIVIKYCVNEKKNM